MKSYANDAPRAMSRIVALTMIVDGHVCAAEVHAMRAAPFLGQVGVDADLFDDTMHALCEDLLESVSNRHAGIIDIDSALLDRVLDEIRDPLLQICMFKTMLDIVHADRRIDSRESLLVRRAARRWFLHYPGAMAAPDAR